MNEDELVALSNAVLRVEDGVITLRTPSGWMLWNANITNEATLGALIAVAKKRLSYETTNEVKND